jgi:hypothetical protein
MREVFRQTKVVRRPTYGIVSGYHELPYVCLGEACEEGYATTEVRGKVQVSPQFIIRPERYLPTYKDIFGEENVDIELSGRIFGFLGFRSRRLNASRSISEVRHTKHSSRRRYRQRSMSWSGERISLRA